MLAQVWELSPDVRLGQLFGHLGLLGEIQSGRSLGDIDDDELMSVLVKHRAELRARLPMPNPELPPLTAASSLTQNS